MRNQYAVVGVGESVRSKASTASTLDMAVSASRNALADAGMDPAEIDAVMSYQALDSCDSHSVATSLGIEPTYCKDILGGGGSTEVLIADAIGLIETGICKSALIYRSLRGRSGKRMGMGGGEPLGRASSYEADRSEWQFLSAIWDRHSRRDVWLDRDASHVSQWSHL